MVTPSIADPSNNFPAFSDTNFHMLCDILAAKDMDLDFIVKTYGYPPIWTRANTFETLVHIILEQQVSLASALSALNKLRGRLKEISPQNVLALTDDELRACYFSRQKTGYVQFLARAILDGAVDLEALEKLNDDEVRQALYKLKGVGSWTADIYLIFVLRRMDVFPPGDLAAVNAFKKLKEQPASLSREAIIKKTAKWAPYRTIATMILWHYYLSLRKKKV